MQAAGSVCPRLPVQADLRVALHALVVLPHLVVSHPLVVRDDKLIQQLQRVVSLVPAATSSDPLQSPRREALVDVGSVLGVAAASESLGHLPQQGGVGPRVNVGAETRPGRGQPAGARRLEEARGGRPLDLILASVHGAGAFVFGSLLVHDHGCRGTN